MEQIAVPLEQDQDGTGDAVDILFRVASLYMQQGTYEQAEPLFKQVLKIWEPVQEMHPWIAESLNDLADISISQDKDEQAEQFYLRALKIWEQIMGPGNRYAQNSLNGLARIYIKQGTYEQAIVVHTRIISFAPKNAAAYLDRGYIYLRFKNSEDACIDFAKYAALEPGNVNAAWMVVYAALSKQHPGVEIAERLEAIAELDPQCHEAYTCRGVALGLRGKLQEGLTALEQALHLNPHSEDALFWKGMVCAYLGHDTLAIESLEQALQVGLPSILLTPLFWLEQERSHFYQEYAVPLLKQQGLL